jgi:hypothetical protein
VRGRAEAREGPLTGVGPALGRGVAPVVPPSRRSMISRDDTSVREAGRKDVESALGNLAARLRQRRDAVERAATEAIYAIADPREAGDLEYLEGLRAAVSAAFDYGIEAVELGERGTPTLPPILLAQARLAARNGVGLDTVLRRYFAGFLIFGECVLEEAEDAGLALRGYLLRRMARAQAIGFDSLIAAVSEEHVREAEDWSSSPKRRHVRRVQQLLAGRSTDLFALGYDFDGWHVGLLAEGPHVVESLRQLGAKIDRQLLLAEPEGAGVWVWLGGRSQVGSDCIADAIEQLAQPETAIGIGEPGQGLEGWRLTHRQASAAFTLASKGPPSTVRYGEVGVLVSLIEDEVLRASLRDLYLTPLEADRDGGVAAKQTLRTYFATNRNVTSAAAALGISRQSVAARLRSIEERCGRNLENCGVEMELALRLDEFENDVGELQRNAFRIGKVMP